MALYLSRLATDYWPNLAPLLEKGKTQPSSSKASALDRKIGSSYNAAKKLSILDESKEHMLA